MGIEVFGKIQEVPNSKAGDIDRAINEFVPLFAGVSTGIAIGELVVGYLVESIEDDMTKIFVKVVGKACLSVILLFVGRRFVGTTKFFLNGTSAGLIASIVGDVASKFISSHALGDIVVKK